MTSDQPYHRAVPSIVRRVVIIVVLAVAVPMLSALPAASAPVAVRTYFRPCDHALYRPRHVQLACGDGNFSLERMRWRNWNRGVANGSGYAQANDCTPTCAGGHFHRYRVTVVLDERQQCPDRRIYYSHLVVHNRSHRQPPFPHEFDPVRINCDGTRA